ncbi:uncharacterized protein BJ171DRAFT_488260 [Polychytrium aggregatum]|uniref:uncharacterized protein n=1 Tax=Polychytrium aggregatum TaxID=110093 RepID=UPI0022FDB417|nr:uncharacterized protein BJ171DRAFT_488260 [Polychytrium aggregatum]KAI9209031.1 hypothetical protein BJ171DRAFT_488260 [Polychytrium aggregatum]
MSLPHAAFAHVYIIAEGAALPTAILPRAVHLLSSVVPSVQVTHSLNHGWGSDSLVISIGNNSVTRASIPQGAVDELEPEGYIVTSKRTENGALLVLADGKATAKDEHTGHPYKHGNLGQAYALYFILEELGFAFLHPLAPAIPPHLTLRRLPVNVRESPRWATRAFHYHTQHPLELVDLLEGWGPQGPEDRAGWDSQLPEWALYLEWLVANKQNAIEWVLLEALTWAEFARSKERQDRLTILVELGHSYGIRIGVDTPIIFAQQHSFRLLRNGTGQDKDFENEKQEIHDSIDYVLSCGFDFLGTEGGTSEFTHPDAKKMLDYMNAVADYAREKYNVPTDIKVHCSSGQVAKGFKDERTGEDINFNFLPHFATKNLGVLVHTVEEYALDDPAPTYGNKDFKYLRDFLNWERELGNRKVLFYPETAYWVTVDIDVPLFLPIYADRRVHDLRLLAEDEQNSASKRKMEGQLIFSSGWEWSYWLNDSVAARAVWNPFSDEPTQREAFVRSLRPFTKHLDDHVAAEVEALLADWVHAQQENLIEGKVNGIAPKDIFKRTGHAYLEGWDTWDDISRLLKDWHMPGASVTQSESLDFGDMAAKSRSFGLDPTAVDYKTQVAPLLVEMESRFLALSNRTTALSAKIPAYLKSLWDDVADSARITYLRIRLVHALYEYVDRAGGVYQFLGISDNAKFLDVALHAIKEASHIVKRREVNYRADADRLAGWTGLNKNPTSYSFRYLWMVRSLHLWWRDIGRAVDRNYKPGFMNVINPLEVGLSQGEVLSKAEDIAAVINKLGLISNILDLKSEEPKWPQDIPNFPAAIIERYNLEH